VTPLELEIAATPEDVMRGCVVLRGFLEAGGLRGEIVSDVVLAFEEVGANVVGHAYVGSEPGKLWLTAQVASDCVRLEIRDAGPPFDPLRAAAPDLEAHWRELRVGGLGIHIVRSLAQRAEYTRRDGRNCLALRFRRHAEVEDPCP
jgi:serine/threonine-protein kinase RsbW